MDSVGEGEGGEIWENGIETCIISCMKRKKKKKGIYGGFPDGLLLLLSPFSCVRLCATPATAAHQASPSLVSETAKETLMYRTVFWTLWERERVERLGRMALKHV